MPPQVTDPISCLQLSSGAIRADVETMRNAIATVLSMRRSGQVSAPDLRKATLETCRAIYDRLWRRAPALAGTQAHTSAMGACMALLWAHSAQERGLAPTTDFLLEQTLECFALIIPCIKSLEVSTPRTVAAERRRM